MPRKRKSLFRRIILWFLIGIPAIILAFFLYVLIIAIDHPPQIADLTPLEKEVSDRGGNTWTLDSNWLRKSETGLWEAYIQGEPFERGVAFGRLTRELLHYQETSFVEQIRELVPSDAYLKVLKYFTAFFNRHLDRHITEEYKQEIYGTSFSCSPEFDFIGTGYQRQLNYHAAHDIGHALQGLNLVGCTSFSVWDGSSSDSSLLVGRNFDFYMGNKFAENKIVCFVNPSTGYRFMMITWAGMIGVVSGMNEKGLTVTLNAARSAMPGKAATPVALLAREILQYASNITEAYNISKKRTLFVSESIMIGSSLDGKTAIIEKSPHADDIVYPVNDRIVCSNHYQGSVFADDEINLENIRGSDSYARYSRVNELINRQKQLSVNRVVDILRNHKGLGDMDVGMGNPLAINQLIAHHSVVFKPDSLLAWVSVGPWQSGKFVAYDLKKVFLLTAEDIQSHKEIYTSSRTIPADTFLYSDAFRRFLHFRELTDSLKKAGRNEVLLPSRFEGDYVRSNPSFYLTYVHLADYYAGLKKFDKAYQYYTQALSKKVPGKAEENTLEEKKNKLAKKLSHDTPRN